MYLKGRANGSLLLLPRACQDSKPAASLSVIQEVKATCSGSRVCRWAEEVTLCGHKKNTQTHTEPLKPCIEV